MSIYEMNATGKLFFGDRPTDRPTRCIISVDSPFPSCSPSISRLGPPENRLNAEREKENEKEQERERERRRSSLIPSSRPQPSCAYSRPASHLRGLVTLEFVGEYSVLLLDRNLYVCYRSSFSGEQQDGTVTPVI